MVYLIPINFPLSCHILLTSKCNLSCPSCFYRSEGEISFPDIVRLLGELRKAGTRSVAFGGGEPLLHPQIEKICDLAKSLGFYTAVTTNGTILKNIHADRVHISFDELHQNTRKQVEKAIRYYRSRVLSVGVNHIYTNEDYLKEALSLPVTYLTILLRKPLQKKRNYKFLEKLYPKNQINNKNIWIDACLMKDWQGIECRQGILSMSINSQLQCSRCSNIKHTIPYTSIHEVWKKVQKQEECLIKPKSLHKKNIKRR